MRRSVEPVDLAEVRDGLEGKPFRQLIQHHLSRQGQEARIQGIRGAVASLPEGAQGFVERFIEHWNTRGYDRGFWSTDAATVFDDVIADAESVLSEAGLPGADDTLFTLFNIVVQSYAYSAYDQPKMRTYIGVRTSGFPWLSAVSLLYPVSAVTYVATRTPANIPTVVGYGLANLGYLLFAAGLLAGKFGIFGLKKRWQVFVAGVVSFLVGTVLCNLASWNSGP